MRVPKKSTATYKKAYFFHPILPAHPIFPAFSALPPVSLVPPVSPVPQSPVRLALPILPAFSALSEKFSSIPSLYFRYRKDTASPKDCRKMSKVQTSNHHLKTRKISYSSSIHNLLNFSFLPVFLVFPFLPLIKKISCYY